MFHALGTTVTVATADADVLDTVLNIVSTDVAALDRAASRFRADSELAALHEAGGAPVEVSDTLLVALQEALDAAALTGGLLDPTIGEALERCGYDRDFADVSPSGPPLTIRFARVPGWRGVRLDPVRHTAAVPAGVRIDLGATAKAGCADRSAARAAAVTGCGVLVNLGGDIAVAGEAPPGGWSIRVADRHDAGPDDQGVTIAIASGGLATSGTSARRWQRGGELLHHVINPATGRPAEPCWRTVTVAASSCLLANIGSTAAVVLGPSAPRWLADRNLHARLVAEDGSVTGVAGWPRDALASDTGVIGDVDVVPC